MGAQGPKGDTGAAGADGAAGPKGDAGAKGDVGAPGAPGADGARGVDGTNGADGAPGERGPSDGFAVTHHRSVDIGEVDTHVTQLDLPAGTYLVFASSEATSTDIGTLRCELIGPTIASVRNLALGKESTVSLSLSGSITLDSDGKVELVCREAGAPIRVAETTLSAIAVAKLTATEE